MKSILYNIPIKLQLLVGMLIAANTAALFIYLACKVASFEIDYIQALVLFLIYRVMAFMANKQMPLTDENVKFMSSERILWNLSSFAVLMVTWAIVSAAWAVMGLIKWAWMLI